MRFSACAHSVTLGVTPEHECSTITAGTRSLPPGTERSPVTVPGCSTAPVAVGNVRVRIGKLPVRPSARVATPPDVAQPARSTQTMSAGRDLMAALYTRRAPSTRARRRARASDRSRYFSPQSGAATSRSAGTWRSASRRRAATTSAVSGVGSPRSRTPSTTVLPRSEEHTSELQSRPHLVCRLLLEKKNHSDGYPRRWLLDPAPLPADRQPADQHPAARGVHLTAFSRALDNAELAQAFERPFRPTSC